MDDKELIQFLDKIEDLIWEYDKEKKNIERTLKKLRTEISASSNISSINKKSVKKNTQRSMVGFLPGLLQDKEFFTSNQDIIDFSNEVLGIAISAARKRSRNELIGLIVCEVDIANSDKLIDINKFLSNMVDDNAVYQKIKTVKQNKNISWTDLIRSMS